jgi:hypothetical protein
MKCWDSLSRITMTLPNFAFDTQLAISRHGAMAKDTDSAR